jgi:IclR family pca regulon transcriptional regulator
VERTGYAISNQETQLNNISTAAPIIDCDGRAIAAVHVPVYIPRWTIEDVSEKIAPLVVELGQNISQSLPDAF